MEIMPFISCWGKSADGVENLPEQPQHPGAAPVAPVIPNLSRASWPQLLHCLDLGKNHIRQGVIPRHLVWVGVNHLVAAENQGASELKDTLG